MALPNWTIISGSQLADIDERTDVNIELPLQSTDGITVTIISGALPIGLRIENYRINKYILKLPSINQRLLYA